MNQPRHPKVAPLGGQFRPSVHDEAEGIELLDKDDFPPGMGDDLLAMKLSTITKRLLLRDFEDLRVIEQIGGRRFEEGPALVRRRYHLKDETPIISIVAAFAMVVGGSV